MAAGANTTLLEDLLDPQVVADFVDSKLIDNIRLSPLAVIDNTLVGRPGDELTLPSYSTYIGDAESVLEGADIPIGKLSQSTEKVKVAKIGRAVEFTDEAIMSGYNNDIAEQAGRQILMSINSGVESRLITAMNETATLTSTITDSEDPSDGVADALSTMGEDMDGEGVLVCPASFYTRLRKTKDWIPNTAVGADMIIRGRIGMVHGLEVVPMNRMAIYNYTAFTGSTFATGTTYYEKVGYAYTATSDTAPQDGKTYYTKAAAATNTAFIIKPGALSIVMKRDTLVEFDRDKLAQLNYIIGSKLFAPYVYNKSKLVKITLSA